MSGRNKRKQPTAANDAAAAPAPTLAAAVLAVSADETNVDVPAPTKRREHYFKFTPAINGFVVKACKECDWACFVVCPEHLRASQASSLECTL
jgi:hypothetical protein